MSNGVVMKLLLKGGEHLDLTSRLDIGALLDERAVNPRELETTFWT